MDKIKLINRVTSDPKDRALLRAAMFDSKPSEFVGEPSPPVEVVVKKKVSKKKVSKKRTGK